MSRPENGCVFHDLGEYVDDASKFEARQRADVTQVPPRVEHVAEAAGQPLVVARAAKARWVNLIGRFTEPTETGRLRIAGKGACVVRLRSLEQVGLSATEVEVTSDSHLLLYKPSSTGGNGSSVGCVPWEDISVIEFEGSGR